MKTLEALHDEELPKRVPIAESDHTQLGPGRPELRTSVGLNLGELVVARMRFEPRFVGRTVPVEGWVSFLLPLGFTGQYLFNGKALEPFCVGLSTRAEGYVTRGENVEIVGAGLRLSNLKRDLAALSGREPDELALCNGPLRLSGSDFASLRHRLLEASHAPYGADTKQLMGEALYADILEALHCALPKLGKTDRDDKDCLIARRAEECFMALYPRQPSLVELCRAAGVGKNRLYAAFRLLFDETPATYFHRRRFSTTHRSLSRLNPERGLVKQVALKNGFSELGRFSVEYRRLFGESPSSTLAREPIEPS